ncbi:MAG: Rv3235 family protein [Jatrophihabitantaceae bacterium]
MTGTAALLSPPSSIRPAPHREPPFEDELAPRHLSLVGPLDQPLPFRALDPNAPSPLRLIMESDPFAAQPTGRTELPALPAHARRLLIAVIETATGRRSASQLRQHTSPTVQAGLARDAGRISRLGTAARPASLHSLHIAEPADGVAEIAAIVRVGSRFRAVALRLEGLDGRWQCVRLQIG